MIKVISYNIMSGENWLKIQQTLKSFADKNSYSNGDLFVIALQEARDTDNTHIGIEKRLRKIYPDAEITYYLDPNFSVHKLGLVTISQTINPIKSVKIDLPRLQGFIWRLLFKLVKSDVPQHAAILTSYLLPDNEVITIVNVHLEVFGGIQHKLKQAKTIGQQLSQLGSDKVIIVGDFNANYKQIITIIDEIDKDLKIIGDKNITTVGLEHTMSSIFPGNKITHRILKLLGLHKLIRFRTDWILVKNLNLLSQGVLNHHIGSDHFPIRAIFD